MKGVRLQSQDLTTDEAVHPVRLPTPPFSWDLARKGSRRALHQARQRVTADKARPWGKAEPDLREKHIND